MSSAVYIEKSNLVIVVFRDAPIIGSVIGNADYRLIFSYRLSDRYVYQISSRSDIICGQSQSIGN